MLFTSDQIESVFYTWLSVPKRKQLPQLQTYRKQFMFQIPVQQYYFRMSNRTLFCLAFRSVL
jgi:hypothetical protein